MKIKNTTNTKKIIKRNIFNKRVIATGLVIFSLAAVLVFNSKTSNDNGPEYQQAYNLESEEFNYYSTHYLDILRNLNPNDFDQTFAGIYKNVMYSYNNNFYNGSSVFIVNYDDGSTHLVDSNNPKSDLFTGESINSKKTKMVLFKESSLFYELYTNGVITSDSVTLSSEYINNWDGEKHYQTVDLVAQKEASESYEEKYGRR